MPPPNKRDNTVTIEDARIVFKNFAGREGQYNREGDRNFSVLLPPDVAAAMAEDGWNVKYLKPREGDEDGDPQAYIGVSVSYKGRPPQVMLISSRGRTPVSENEIELLDWIDFETVDLKLNPYHWTVGGRGGVKAYLSKMFVTIVEDDLDRKYQDVPLAVGGAPIRQALPSGSDDIIEGEIIGDDPPF